MKRLKSRRHLQRFVSIHDPIANLFHMPRHDIPSSHHRELRAAAMSMWAAIAYVRGRHEHVGRDRLRSTDEVRPTHASSPFSG